MTDYRKLLLFISESLRSEDFGKLKFACQSEIPAGIAQKLTEPFEFFTELEHRNLLSENDQDYLMCKLLEINRGDLKDILKKFQDDASDNQQQETDATQESETESEAEEEPFPDLTDLGDALDLHPRQRVHGEETDAEVDLR